MRFNMSSNEVLTREEREMKHFDEFAQEDGYIWWGGKTPAAKKRWERRRDILKDKLDIKKGHKILDVGAGSGDFTEYIAEATTGKEISITALELSKAQVNVGTKKIKDPRVNFVVGSITKMPFADDSFDYVVGNSILHHLDLDSSFKEIKRVLKPGGQILFFEPNLVNPVVWVLFKIKPFRKLHGASPDEMAFYRWELKQNIEKHNFKDVSVRPFDFMFPLIPEKLFSLTKKIETAVEKTPIHEIGGSLIIRASK